jgi:aryl-alcohol dehydrogenase-like predicted oxidoreductase/enamine deaminase RidA (YjgF/YER057c/UK114 family)
MITPPPKKELAADLSVSRIVTGLWQVADMERDGAPLDPIAASQVLAEYARSGFDTFDMADHYGSAEIITGHLLKRARAGDLNECRPRAFTKWCPTPGPMSAQTVRAGVEERLQRLGVDCIDLLQLHWWSFEHPAYLDALAELARLREAGLIRHVGVTNFDAPHLELIAAHGIPILTNQVSFSVLDRRAAGALSDVCARHGIHLLAYGTLAGGLLSERWLGVAEPGAQAITDWSKMKYRRFVDSIGGWSAYQSVLKALATISKRHDVSIANVANRWVLDHPAVACAIVGARPGERDHRVDNSRAFGWSFTPEDHAILDQALIKTRAVPGDCGDEYRRPPFLTASGDLSHHLASLPRVYHAEAVAGDPTRHRVSSGSQWEPICGYSRAIRCGERIFVSGTTATHGADTVVAKGHAGAQATYVLDKITASLAALGASLQDVVATRIYLADAADCEAVSRVHGRYFTDVRPANLLLEVSRLIGDYRVEIEAEAITTQPVPAPML